MEVDVRRYMAPPMPEDGTRLLDQFIPGPDGTVWTPWTDSNVQETMAHEAVMRLAWWFRALAIKDPSFRLAPAWEMILNGYHGDVPDAEFDGLRLFPRWLPARPYRIGWLRYCIRLLEDIQLDVLLNMKSWSPSREVIDRPWEHKDLGQRVRTSQKIYREVAHRLDVLQMELLHEDEAAVLARPAPAPPFMMETQRTAVQDGNPADEIAASVGTSPLYRRLTALPAKWEMTVLDAGKVDRAHRIARDEGLVRDSGEWAGREKCKAQVTAVWQHLTEGPARAVEVKRSTSEEDRARIYSELWPGLKCGHRVTSARSGQAYTAMKSRLG